MTEDSWEARMALRARQRAAQEAAERRLGVVVAERAAYEANAQREWLHGWPRIGINQVQMGSGIHCVCCGRCLGVTCIVIPEDYQPPGPTPTWPFTEADCPLCPKIW